MLELQRIIYETIMQAAENLKSDFKSRDAENGQRCERE